MASLRWVDGRFEGVTSSRYRFKAALTVVASDGDRRT
jgi:hypothetical protein